MTNIWGEIPSETRHRHPLTEETSDSGLRDCPDCALPLVCLEDYIGGGSHYWSLRCNACDREFTWDTYRFTLEPRMRWTGTEWVVA